MSGATTGGVRTVLRIEALGVFAAALIAYRATGAGWGVFALWFLAPDLSLLAYLVGARTGALVYNIAHSYVGPIACLAASMLLPAPILVTIGLIWGAHIGFDRTLGYGLKYCSGFGFTHLGRIGRTAREAQ
ncbi:MAG TPA: DUF4260 domain-containing protein [Steroidobacteraceae bacterium]|jgi:hypothetical protein|nr:DUF4260 domain-containing protein [Steroidobacteraceae bacterium]